MLSSFETLRETIAAHLQRLDVLPQDYSGNIGNVILEAGGNKTTQQGLWFASWRYRSVLRLHNFPFDKSGLLFCLIKAALDQLHRDKDLEDPEFIFAELENGRRNVDILITFRDKLFLTKSENGPIEINGQKYDRIPFDLWIAEYAQINGDIR